jgi:cytolethal distending toxin subunit A
MHRSIHPLKRHGSAFAALAVFAIASLLAIAGRPSTAAASVFQGPAFTMQNQLSGKCLTPAGGSVGENALIVQYTCDGHPSRSWTFQDGGRLRNVNSGKCLTPAGGSVGDNVIIVQYTCDTHPSRYWTIENGQVRNVYSGKCLSPAGGSVGQNVAVVQYTCDGHLSRYWWFGSAW